MILKVMFSWVILPILSHFDTEKPLLCVFFKDFCDFMAKFGQKYLFWSDIFFDSAI